MKFLIKKYLQFEKQYGTTADLNRAKERITQYVNANEHTEDGQENLQQDQDFDL